MATILESVNDFSEHTYTDRERELIHRLRVMLKDLPDQTLHSLNTLVEEQRGERWSDMVLFTYLQQATADINAEPASTGFDLNNFPEPWTACIINGGMIFSLIAEGILQVGKKIIKFLQVDK